MNIKSTLLSSTVITAALAGLVLLSPLPAMAWGCDTESKAALELLGSYRHGTRLCNPAWADRRAVTLIAAMAMECTPVKSSPQFQAGVAGFNLAVSTNGLAVACSRLDADMTRFETAVTNTHDDGAQTDIQARAAPAVHAPVHGSTPNPLKMSAPDLERWKANHAQSDSGAQVDIPGRAPR